MDILTDMAMEDRSDGEIEKIERITEALQEAQHMTEPIKKAIAKLTGAS